MRPLTRCCVLEGANGNNDRRNLWLTNQGASVFDGRLEERAILRLIPGSLMGP